MTEGGWKKCRKCGGAGTVGDGLCDECGGAGGDWEPPDPPEVDDA